MNLLPFLARACLFFSYIHQTLADGQAMSVNITQCTGDTDIFTVDSVSVSCDDDDCGWGSDATFYGSYTIGDTLSTDSPIITAKIWGMDLYDDTVDICNGGSVYNDNGDYCPDTGTYDFLATSELPWYFRFTFWMSSTVYTTFDFGDVVVTCDVKIEASTYSSSSSSSTSYIMSASALMITGVVFGLRIKKRRRLVTANEEGGHEEPATHFVEMTSP